MKYAGNLLNFGDIVTGQGQNACADIVSINDQAFLLQTVHRFTDGRTADAV